MTDPPLEIRSLGPSFDAMGRVLDLLSRHPPFAQYRLDRIGAAIRRQLASGSNVAAMERDGKLVGYAGWANALPASAQLWIEDRGPLEIVDQPMGAVALTIVASARTGAVALMIRRARALNPGVEVYFKRSYITGSKPPRKASLANTGS
jgi:hypothetical protein